MRLAASSIAMVQKLAAATTALAAATRRSSGRRASRARATDARPASGAIARRSAAPSAPSTSAPIDRSTSRDEQHDRPDRQVGDQDEAGQEVADQAAERAERVDEADRPAGPRHVGQRQPDRQRRDHPQDQARRQQRQPSSAARCAARAATDPAPRRARPPARACRPRARRRTGRAVPSVRAQAAPGRPSGRRASSEADPGQDDADDRGPGVERDAEVRREQPPGDQLEHERRALAAKASRPPTTCAPFVDQGAARWRLVRAAQIPDDVSGLLDHPAVAPVRRRSRPPSTSARSIGRVLRTRAPVL